MKLSYIPKMCSACNSTFCTPCLANHVNHENEFCPKCYLNKSDFMMPLNLRFIFDDVKIKCKNHDFGCDKELDFFQLTALQNYCKKCENSREQCANCEFKCDGCSKFITFGAKSTHNCGKKKV
jgi:hypothetical protein